METASNLPSWCTWMEKQGLGGIVKRQTLVSAIDDRKSWRARIANLLKEHNTKKKNAGGIGVNGVLI